MKRALILIAACVAIINLPNLYALYAGDIDYDAAQAGEVTLYATSWCGYCSKTRHFFRKNDIPFTEIDIEESSEGARQMMALGGFGVPVIVIGDTVIKGYQPAAIAAALNAKH